MFNCVWGVGLYVGVSVVMWARVCSGGRMSVCVRLHV